MKIPLEITLGLVFLISFFTVIFLTPMLIRKLKNMKYTGPDQNKPGKPEIPRMGGITIVLAFTLAALLSMQLSSQAVSAPLMLAAVCTVVLISFLGFMDDVLKIRDLYRVVLPAFAALPLMAIQAGVTTINLPLLGAVDTNLGAVMLPVIGPVTFNLYVILLIPIGVVACSNLVNLLAGYNGLEAGIGAIVSAALLLASLQIPSAPGVVVSQIILLSTLAACLAFLIYNWYPSRVFPGNVTTYLLGAVIVSAVVLGNMERVGVIALGPQIIEFFLKARGKFQAENFGKPDAAGRLRYKGQTQSLTHFFIKLLKPTEPQLVGALLALQAFFALLAVLSVNMLG